MDKITHEMRLTHWKSVISECRNSGLSVRAWCIQNNIDEKRFYYWQRRVRGAAFDSLKKSEFQSQTSFIQLPVNNDTLINNPSFKPDIVMHIGNNILELSNTVSEELLSKVLKVMSNVK